MPALTAFGGDEEPNWFNDGNHEALLPQLQDVRTVDVAEQPHILAEAQEHMAKQALETVLRKGVYNRNYFQKFANLGRVATKGSRNARLN